MSKKGQWIGVDLDGTLAYFGGWKDATIGDPVPLMAQRVKQWLSEGVEVRLFTNRAAIPQQAPMIYEWCVRHFGCGLPITDRKDFGMIALYDDRAIQVEMNTGKIFDKISSEQK